LLGDNLTEDQTDNQEVSQDNELTIEKLRDFRPDESQTEATKEVFVKMAVLEIIKPIVRGYQIKILNEMKVRPIKVFDAGTDIITNPKHAYLMSDEDFKIYLEKCNIEREKAGLYVKTSEHCPLLVAECELMEAEQRLIKAMKPLTGITQHNLLCCKNGLEKHREFLDMMLTLVSHHVDFKVI